MGFEPFRHRAVAGLGLLLVSLLAFTAASTGEQQDEAWIDELTIGHQAGVRLDVGAAPFAGSGAGSLLGLGVGTDLHLFGGDLVIQLFPNVTSYGSYETVLQRGTRILLVRYEEDMEVLREICYVITVYVEGKEYLFWRNAVFAELDQDDGWSIELEWSVDPLLANLTSFDVPVGYRVYRRFIPNDVIGTVCSTSFADLVLIEEFPAELGQSKIVFADHGVYGQKDEGRPGIAAPGQVSVSKPPGSLSVGRNLGVGVTPPSGGPGDARFAGNVGIGGPPTGTASLNIVDPSGPSIRMDATPLPGSTPTGGKVWTLQSAQGGSFAITESAAPGGFCAGGDPRLEIDGIGAVGLGVSPAGAAGSLEVAHSLGVGMASSAQCGDADFAGSITANAAVIAVDLTVGGAIDAADLLVMNDVDVLNDLFVVGNADVLDLHVDGDLDVDGNLDVGGVKFFVQEHPTDSTKEIAYAALEGPEAGTYVRGTAHLTNGEAVIELPESFALVTAGEGLTVQVTLLDPCNGLYVAEKSTERIVVLELLEGTSNARFDYLVQGVRSGYEDYDPIRRSEGEN